MIGRLSRLAGDAGTYLPQHAGPARRLKLAIALRALESLLLAVAYTLLYPVMQRLFAGTITVDFIGEITAAIAVCYALRMVLFHVSANSIYAGIYAQTGTLRLRIVDHLRGLPLGMFQTDRLANIRSILTDDLQQAGKYAGSLTGFIVSAMTLPLFLVIALAAIDWKLALAMSFSTLLGLPMLLILNRYVAHHGKHHLESTGNSSARLLEYVLGIKVLKSYGLTGSRFVALEEALASTRDKALTLELGIILLLVAATILIELGFPLLLLYGAYAALNGTVGMATVIFALILSVRFYTPLQDALALSTEFQYLNTVLDRVVDVLSLKRQKMADQPATAANNVIALENVSFRYEEDGEAVLSDIDLTMREGTMTALVGPSGAGKTTVTNLIARFWDAQEGRVTIGGVDVRDMKFEDLMARIAIVFQDVVLFHDSIMENIRMGRPDARDAEVMDAARRAQCHDFIAALPAGYATTVGEGGSRLSGGEKQRISIARALLKDAPIVLLDEATASVDPSAEKDIQKAFAALASNKTVIVIAHKLATITHADQIAVMENGRIVQRGRHDDLLAREGLYRTLWSNQMAASAWQV